ncbi:uncharacterized protein ACR2FA_004863 [Aphomia sociella]
MASKVWSTFTAKKSDGSQVKLRVQDLPSNSLEEVINLFSLYGDKEDIISKLLGIKNNPEAAEELKQQTRDMLTGSPHEIVVCSLDDNPDKIIAVSVIGIASASEKLEDIQIPTKTKVIEKLWEVYIKLYGLYDVCEAHSLKSYYVDRGLVVIPGFVDLDIRKELLNVRRKISKENNVPLTGGWMVSKEAQEAAAADGWQTVYEIRREELGPQIGIAITEGPETWKFMVAKAL